MGGFQLELPRGNQAKELYCTQILQHNICRVYGFQYLLTSM